MNFNQTFSILFWLNKSKTNKKGLVPIWVRITIDGDRSECSVSRQIDPQFWNTDTGKPMKDYDDGDSLVQYLLLVQAEITRHYNVLLSTKEYVTAEDVKRSYKCIKEKVVMFVDVFEQFLKTLEERKENQDLSGGRCKHFKTLFEKNQSFIKTKYRRTDLPINELKLSFINEFYHYLRTTEKIEQNTAMKHCKNLKQVIDYAVMLEYLPSNPFQFFKCSFKKTRRTKLTMEEVEKIYNKEIKNARLSEVRDCYIFGIYTGYAFKQQLELTPDNVQVGIDGRKWIVIDRSKTDSPENVPLLPIAEEIIERYINHPYCKAFNKLLPVNSNQRYNEYLKEIAAICDINKNLTTHTGRHTFATTIALENGVPLETVSKLLGHNDIRTTQVYAEITQIKLSEDTLDLSTKIEQRRAKGKDAKRYNGVNSF